MRMFLSLAAALVVAAGARPCGAVQGGELFTDQSYTYGKFEAAVRFAPGNGVVSSFFLWKLDSEKDTVFWNELDFEKITDNCNGYQVNVHWGPGTSHSQDPLWVDGPDLCADYHVHAFVWTPSTIQWLLDGTVIKEATPEQVQAFADNAQDGMQFRFNLWVGNASFGGVFSDAILPVYQYIDWVQYAAYTPGSGDGGSDFTVQWRDDFDGDSLASGWRTGTWTSPLGLSTHNRNNVRVCDGAAIIALTADDAAGIPCPLDTAAAGGDTSGTQDTSAGTAQGTDEAQGTDTAAASSDAAGNPGDSASPDGEAAPDKSDDSGCSVTWSAPASWWSLLVRLLSW